MKARLKVPRRSQTVVIEYHAGEFLVLFDDGTIQPAESASAALRLVKQAAGRRNPGLTVTTIQWRGVPDGFVAPTS